MRFRGNGMCMHSQAEDLEAFILRTDSSGCALIYLNGPGPGAAVTAVTATCTNQRLTNPRRRCQPMAEPHPSDGDNAAVPLCLRISRTEPAVFHRLQRTLPPDPG